MRITAAEETKRGRIALFADGEFAFSVCLESWLGCGLSAGAEVTAEALERLRAEDEYLSARDKALTLLSYSSHSRGMLLEKLRRRFSPEACEAAADRMAELGLLDDRGYARRCAADMQHLRGYSLRRIAYELERRHIPREYIEEAVAALGAESEIPAIAAIIEKKHRSKLTAPEGERKVVASLLRQGFRLEDIKQALFRLREETEEYE